MFHSKDSHSVYVRSVSVLYFHLRLGHFSDLPFSSCYQSFVLSIPCFFNTIKLFTVQIFHSFLPSYFLGPNFILKHLSFCLIFRDVKQQIELHKETKENSDTVRHGTVSEEPSALLKQTLAELWKSFPLLNSCERFCNSARGIQRQTRCISQDGRHSAYRTRLLGCLLYRKYYRTDESTSRA